MFFSLRGNKLTFCNDDFVNELNENLPEIEPTENR